MRLMIKIDYPCLHVFLVRVHSLVYSRLMAGYLESLDWSLTGDTRTVGLHH